MNSTRVLLNSGGSTPVASINMAVRICLASSPPLHSFLSNYDDHRSSPVALQPRLRPLPPCRAVLSSGCRGTVAVATRRSAESGGGGLGKRKSVVFADRQGLALATVHVFSRAEDDALSDLQFQLTEIEGAAAGRRLRDATDHADPGSGLVLDFTPPAADYLDLRNRLQAQQVSLETCSLQDRLLSGTVQVRNVCFEKSVLVRITFDSWTSYRNISCRFLQNVYGGPDTDTFSFSILVPEVLDPSSRVEFCIQYRTPGRTFWDNNLGNNYGLAVLDLNGCPSRNPVRTEGLEVQRDRGGEKWAGMDFDPFGSPRTSAGIFPKWQSWGHLETTAAPYW